MTMKNDTKIEEELTCRFKIDMRIFTNIDPSTRKSQKFKCFNWLLVTKVHNIWATKVHRSYLSWHWRVVQNLKKKWHLVWKMTWEIWQIFTKALKSLKIGTSVQSRRGMTLKFSQDMSQELYVTFQELCVMTMKNNANVEEELTCHFKTDMGNLTNFDSSTRKSEGKLTCAFKNDMRNLTNMHRLK